MKPLSWYCLCFLHPLQVYIGTCMEVKVCCLKSCHKSSEISQWLQAACFSVTLWILLLSLKFKWNSPWRSWVCAHHVPSSKVLRKVCIYFHLMTYSTFLAQKPQNTQKGVWSLQPFFSEVQSGKITYVAGFCPLPPPLGPSSSSCHRALRQ